MKDLNETRNCTRCEGAGVTHSQWAKDNGFEGPEGRVCLPCEGSGSFPGLDLEAILGMVLTSRGKVKKFRKAWPSNLNVWSNGDRTVKRAYYVWRMARFHGGADVTMPMTATTVSSGDPFEKEMDAFASQIAIRVFGTNLAAASRWAPLVHREIQVPKGMPDSAYPGGRVSDGNKPDFEILEILR